jgi:hypothetical protein
MSEIINVNGNELLPVVYKDQRVVTFQMIDQVHERVSGTARTTFNRNKERFEETKDYFFVKPEEFAKCTDSALNTSTAYVKRTRSLRMNKDGAYLITERGYLKLVKPFNDALSWKVQDMLVDSYFKMKEIVNNNPENQVNIDFGKELLKVQQHILNLYTITDKRVAKIETFIEKAYFNEVKEAKKDVLGFDKVLLNYVQLRSLLGIARRTVYQRAYTEKWIPLKIKGHKTVFKLSQLPDYIQQIYLEKVIGKA